MDGSGSPPACGWESPGQAAAGGTTLGEPGVRRGQMPGWGAPGRAWPGGHQLYQEELFLSFLIKHEDNNTHLLGLL